MVRIQNGRFDTPLGRACYWKQDPAAAEGGACTHLAAPALYLESLAHHADKPDQCAKREIIIR